MNGLMRFKSKLGPGFHLDSIFSLSRIDFDIASGGFLLFPAVPRQNQIPRPDNDAPVGPYR